MAKGKHSADGGGYYFDQKNERIEEKNDINNDEYYEEYDDEPNITKIKIICALVAIIVIVGVALFISTRGSNKDNSENLVQTNTVAEPIAMESTYEGYKVLGKIKIKKLNVEQYILDSTEEEALKKGISKLYGGSLNNYGNLCLAGHNFDNMFGKLNELDKGDIITIVEKDFSETEYEVKDILTVEPTDLEALIPDENKVEITLITCESASTERLIIKAEEK
jgi:LPXTG-site transpeptidase (sortase) family protein